MSKKYTKIIAFILVFLMWTSFAMAENDFPEIMVGQTEATFSSTPASGGNPGSSIMLAKNGSIRVDNTVTEENPDTLISTLGGEDENGDLKPFTVMAWIKPTNQTDPDQTIISMGNRMTTDANVAGKQGWAIGIHLSDATHYSVQVSVGSSTKGYLLRSDLIDRNTLFDGNWHHIMFSIDLLAVNQPVAIGFDTTYKSPAVTNIAGGTANPDTATPDPIFIGNAAGNYSGQIDEVRIYDRVALSDVEFAQCGTLDPLYVFENGQLHPENLVARWMFDEGTGGVGDITHGMSNDTDGLIIAGVTWGTNILPLNVNAGPTVQMSFYGGFTGNETVYNSLKSAGQNNGSSTDELFGFRNTELVNCINNALVGVVRPYTSCFQSNSSNSSIRVVSSRTSVANKPVIETAVLFYPAKMVTGDVYGSGLNNFAFWGRNLHQQSGAGDPGSDATWRAGGYTLNPNAQSTLSGAEFDKNSNKINALKGEAPVANADTGTRSDWYLQTPTEPAPTTTTMMDDITNADASKFPEGKVWNTLPGTLTVRSVDKKYHGRGTIIVNGDLIINNGIDILPATSADRLGFIVTGSVRILGNNKIQASIYCPNSSITASSGNVELIGSFVANAFTISAANARFYYDYALDSAWPPGFRFLNMPHPVETKQ